MKRARFLLYSLALTLTSCGNHGDLTLTTTDFSSSAWKSPIEKALTEMRQSGLAFGEDTQVVEFDKAFEDNFSLRNPFLTRSRQIETLSRFCETIDKARKNGDASMTLEWIQKRDLAHLRKLNEMEILRGKTRINQAAILGYDQTILYTDQAKVILQIQLDLEKKGTKFEVDAEGRVSLTGNTPAQELLKLRSLLETFLQQYRHELVSPVLENQWRLLISTNFSPRAK